MPTTSGPVSASLFPPGDARKGVYLDPRPSLLQLLSQGQTSPFPQGVPSSSVPFRRDPALSTRAQLSLPPAPHPPPPRSWGVVGVSEPGVPGGVHATEVVQAVGGRHQGVDLALPALELGQVVEAGHDGRDGLLDQDHQLLGVHVLGLAGGGQGHGRVLLGLLVPRDDLVPEHRLQDAVHLLGTKRKRDRCRVRKGFSFFVCCCSNCWLNWSVKQTKTQMSKKKKEKKNRGVKPSGKQAC